VAARLAGKGRTRSPRPEANATTREGQQPPGLLWRTGGAAPPRHNGFVFAVFQEQASSGLDLREVLQNLGWVDASALGVCAVFCVLGVFKGMIWQVSRVAILVAAYYGAMEFGEPLSETLLAWTHTGPDAPTGDQVTTAQCIAYVLLFLFVLVGLSLLALLLQSLARKAGLGFYDRLFGGALGAATGALVVLVLMTGVLLFLPPQSRVALAAHDSHSLRILQDGIAELGGVAPPALRRVFVEEGHGEPSASDPTHPPMQGVPVEASGAKDGAPADGTSLLPPDGGERRDH